MAARAIYLVGFSGTGKSTIAQLIGERLGWPAYDIDRMIVEQSGMEIPQIFEREGEAGFRQRETAVLRQVARGGPCVVATGGGAMLADENRQLMFAGGWVVALEGRPEVLLARIRQHAQSDAPDALRPMLAADDQLEQIRALKQRRQAIYALADWTVHTDRLSQAQVAAEVIRAVDLLASSGAGA